LPRRIVTPKTLQTGVAFVTEMFWVNGPTAVMPSESVYLKESEPV